MTPENSKSEREAVLAAALVGEGGRTASGGSGREGKPAPEGQVQQGRNKSEARRPEKTPSAQG